MNNHSYSESIIDVRHLNKSFNGIKAVSDLTLKIKAGSIFGFMGANGSGKTTSIRLLCGLLLPDSGEGFCLGHDLFTEIKLIQLKIGYMPQFFCLYRNLSVYENLDFIARIYGLKHRKQRLAEILELFSLKDRKDQISHTLSGGWKQRLSLAAAVLHQPSLLLLDEPTAGIDPQSRVKIWEYIQDIVSKGVTVLLSTHYMDEAERCHQLAYMANGKILTHGSSRDIINSTGLTTWQVLGPHLSQFKQLIKPYLDQLQLIEKGHEIRLSSLNPNVLKKINPSIFMGYKINLTHTNLEDVFIFKSQNEGNIT